MSRRHNASSGIAAAAEKERFVYNALQSEEAPHSQSDFGKWIAVDNALTCRR